ncbi:MAG: glycerol-3-phosphate dehydrogenase [Alphaproteobacteria bacterium]|nr:glycerol-3-phosphate dehydrogenase [Alphaproteobacteria bacterium]
MSENFNQSHSLNSKIFDLVVIGGGINGTGIARDAAGRGLSVCLIEQNDLANFTSSSSTKLIHGGLRYLEYYEFRLVRESLIEREILLKLAPHIIWPLNFVLPHHKDLRPIWMIQLGLFLYDHLGGRKILPASKKVDLTNTIFGNALKSSFTKGFTYSDCWVDDARLVILNALDAYNKGAIIKTRTLCTKAERIHNNWSITLKDKLTQEYYTIKAKILINATGPWVTDFIENKANIKSDYHLRLTKGSHIIVPKLYDGQHAYILQNKDKRIVFTIPYEQNYTLIGTTDISVNKETLGQANVSQEEINYLCHIVSSYFKKVISADDVKWHYSGIRPLYDDAHKNASAVTRDYVLHLDNYHNLPLLSIFGGKITTYRKLSEHVMEKLKPFFPNLKSNWTAKSILPGGDIKEQNISKFFKKLSNDFLWLPESLIHRYARTYGTLTYQLLNNVSSIHDMGINLGDDLYTIEIDYLIKHEWAQTSEDILWRRTKLGLHINQKTKEKLDDYLKQKLN